MKVINVYDRYYQGSCEYNGVELNLQFIGELATLGQQLLRYFLYLSTFNFAIYKYVIHISISQ